MDRDASLNTFQILVFWALRDSGRRRLGQRVVRVIAESSNFHMKGFSGATIAGRGASVDGMIELYFGEGATRSSFG